MQVYVTYQRACLTRRAVGRALCPHSRIRWGVGERLGRVVGLIEKNRARTAAPRQRTNDRSWHTRLQHTAFTWNVAMETKLVNGRYMRMQLTVKLRARARCRRPFPCYNLCWHPGWQYDGQYVDSGYTEFNPLLFSVSPYYYLPPGTIIYKGEGAPQCQKCITSPLWNAS